MHGSVDAEQSIKVSTLINQLHKRTRVAYVRVIERLSGDLKYDYSQRTFSHKFREDHIESFELGEVLSVVRSFVVEADEAKRCTAEEAFQLFRLTRIGIDKFSELQSLFPAEEYKHAWQQYFPNERSESVDVSSAIQSQIRDYRDYIDDKTQGFVGRRFIFDAVKQFTEQYPQGYCIIRGDPGIGKTSIAAQLVKNNDYIHHFNIRTEGINKGSDFLRNVCAQLIAKYHLSYPVIPVEATQDTGFLNKLLSEVSRKLEGKKCIIVVDALDEANTSNDDGANVLFLPVRLPEAVYIITTARTTPLNLRVETPEISLYIDHNGEGNIADIHEYIASQISKPRLQNYIHHQRIEENYFIDSMIENSEGNFMYLRFVLPEIETGFYKNLRIEDMPKGLNKYYQDHWNRMKERNPDLWFEYKLPVLVALTVAREPVSIDLIQEFSNINDIRRVRVVIREWQEFLHKHSIEASGNTQHRYRLYHASFFEFISSREEIADERVDLKAMNKQIADVLLKNWRG